MASHLCIPDLLIQIPIVNSSIHVWEQRQINPINLNHVNHAHSMTKREQYKYQSCRLQT